MNIRPFEIDLLTVEQLDRSIQSIDQQLAELKKGGDDGR